ncbi:hypothetical protein AAMO2058_000414200 [Amorphochlora amoebiformis]
MGLVLTLIVLPGAVGKGKVYYGGDDDPDIDRGTTTSTSKNKAGLKEEGVSIETCLKRSSRIWKRVEKRNLRDDRRRRRTRDKIDRIKMKRERKVMKKLSKPVFRFRPDLNIRAEVPNPFNEDAPVEGTLPPEEPR